MKIYLIDPNKKWCKANLHCHTNFSDGYFSPGEIKKHYMEQGYSIIAYSDHEVIYDHSDLTDESFVALTSTEYSINCACGKTIHLCLFSKDPHNTFQVAAGEKNFNHSDLERHKKFGKGELQFDGYNRKFTQESIQETIDRANRAGWLVQFNHPNWSLNTREDYINLKGLWSLEVLNYLTEIETGAEYCINIYDDMLRHGQKLLCTMGDDNHNFNGSFEGSFGGFNYIGVDELNYENVYNAMKDGTIYCSSGPIIKSIYIDTDEWKIYVECSEAEDIIFTGYGRAFRHYYGNNLTKADFKIFGGEKYFRITIKDKFGKVAHTHAYFLEDYGYDEL